MTVQLVTTPYWTESASMAGFAALDRNLTVDVAIVGGGITGLTAAYLLTAAGRSVALLERRTLASVDTGHTTAHLTMVTDTLLTDLVASFGRDHAQAVCDAGLAAVSRIDQIAREETIACDFRWVPGYLHAAGKFADQDVKALQDESLLAADFGFDAAFIDRVPVMNRPGVRFGNQARFHPRKYLAGLVRAIVAGGGRIFEHSEAAEFSETPRFVRANGHIVSCDYVVIATHTPLMGIADLAGASLFQTKLALFTSYALAGRVAKGQLPDALWWDTGTPYYYLRLEPHPDFDLVIVGGEDHKTGQADNTAECYERLERALASVVPNVEVTHRWSGQVIETTDGLPYIGETAERQFAATGFAGNGMTFGTLAGLMATDRVLGRTNPWTNLFDPGRKTLSGAWDYLKKNTDYPYYMIRDRLVGAEAKSPGEVPRGEGKVLEYGGEQVAVYRDESGATTMRSAICTHLGCLVEWNTAERTWDCPCHGSRFEPDGSVIAGPAEDPLGPTRKPTP
jgi:glycine/D-amino acid oxidase-like deaminating enzyme/nitrite reductase/ring-hydroxylating ferredoxin subunit